LCVGCADDRRFFVPVLVLFVFFVLVILVVPLVVPRVVLVVLVIIVVGVSRRHRIAHDDQPGGNVLGDARGHVGSCWMLRHSWTDVSSRARGRQSVCIAVHHYARAWRAASKAEGERRDRPALVLRVLAISSLEIAQAWTVAWLQVHIFTNTRMTSGAVYPNAGDCNRSDRWVRTRIRRSRVRFPLAASPSGEAATSLLGLGHDGKEGIPSPEPRRPPAAVIRSALRFTFRKKMAR